MINLLCRFGVKFDEKIYAFMHIIIIYIRIIIILCIRQFIIYNDMNKNAELLCTLHCSAGSEANLQWPWDEKGYQKAPPAVDPAPVHMKWKIDHCKRKTKIW